MIPEEINGYLYINSRLNVSQMFCDLYHEAELLNMDGSKSNQNFDIG